MRAADSGSINCMLLKIGGLVLHVSTGTGTDVCMTIARPTKSPWKTMDVAMTQADQKTELSRLSVILAIAVNTVNAVNAVVAVSTNVLNPT